MGLVGREKRQTVKDSGHYWSAPRREHTHVGPLSVRNRVSHSPSGRGRIAGRHARCATTTSRELPWRSYFAPIFTSPHHSIGRNPSRRRASESVCFVQIRSGAWSK